MKDFPQVSFKGVSDLRKTKDVKVYSNEMNALNLI